MNVNGKVTSVTIAVAEQEVDFSAQLNIDKSIKARNITTFFLLVSILTDILDT